MSAAGAWVVNTGDESHLTVLPEPPTEAEDDAVQVGNLERGLTAYQQIMGLDSENGMALTCAGVIQADEGNHAAAEWLLRRSIQVAPTCLAYNTLGHVLVLRRKWDDSIEMFRRSMALDPTNTTTWPNLLFGLDLHPWATPALKLAERRRFNDLHCKALTDAAGPHTNDPDPDRVLKVGYVSADFKQHSAAHGFGPLIVAHHRDRFEVHLYDVNQEPPNADDLVTRWFQTHEGTIWHDVRGYDDATLAATIRADGIDILVDLSGYSAGGRVLAFARKPAPVQITGFGYTTGLGIDAVGYLVADDVLIPPQHEGFYHERILRAPIYMGYEQAPPWPDLTAPPKERNGYVTFGYLGRAIKLSPQTLAAWGDILTRVPASRLLLKSGEYVDVGLREQIGSALVALGVASDRIEFRFGTSRFEHLETYGDVDISLDPFPHNGGVTTVESLLMGVPTVTLLGGYVCGRTGASLLTSMGFQQAIARTPYEYVGHAIATAAETWTLADRQGLRTRVAGSVLLDSERYTTAIEALYREAWAGWCSGRVPVAGD